MPLNRPNRLGGKRFYRGSHMPNYLTMPRQRGISMNPMSTENPRRFARTRCEKAINALDRVIMNMGELIQLYSPQESLPADMIKEGLDLIDYCKENNIELTKLLDLASFGRVPLGDLGQFAGYIAIAALIMQTAQTLQPVVQELRGSI